MIEKFGKKWWKLSWFLDERKEILLKLVHNDVKKEWKGENTHIYNTIKKKHWDISLDFNWFIY